MGERDMNDIRKEFDDLNLENFAGGNPAFCPDGQCDTEEVDLQDYPSYTEALYAKLISPYVSGIYISRWDIKEIALAAGDSMAIHPRKRMFELLMKYATSRENMQAVLDALENHMEEKISIYEEFMASFPASKEIFKPKIDKARKTIKIFPQIIEEYFLEDIV
ncbi:MAG: hypothetical protein LGB07_06425 [Sulfurovum sp.]|nr:hypothetical protein [Sulfurovum sp.]MCB4745268.1 hypothetical protein [Sulfurovum sp.]MCB4745768.1 hypothetical protein [Sulfurovum sp.]MCB4747606.1 hypothetical protein [Sulfurovum sp.]MCB4749317.1 hypothetical protein [Sulfurovum sp.]